MDFDRNASAGYLINLMARHFARHLEAALKPHGLALGAFPALLHLWENDGLTQRELVDLLGIEQPTMAATLARMERDGLITRHRDEGDARVQRVRLTDHARNLRPLAIAKASETNAQLLAALGAAEQQQLIALMQRVVATTGPPTG